MSGPASPEAMSKTEGDPGREAPRPPPRKRRRIVISCIECHRRKQKCDRLLPCTNCQSRNKESACRYETGTPVPRPDRGEGGGGSAPPNAATAGSGGSPRRAHPAGAQVDLGYSSHAGVSTTMGMLHHIQGAGSGEPLAGMPTSVQANDSLGQRESYKTLIRQLPARTYIDRLVDIYFQDVHWQCFAIDEPLFRDLTAQWYDLPFNVLSGTGPQALSPSLRAFPALLFQLLASALLYLPTGSEETFESLKYTSNMTFDDLAIEYSNSGIEVLAVLGKRRMSLINILAGLTRAAFLKYTGKVTESWHQLGATVRDAQEIGIHRDQNDPQPNSEDSTEEIIEKMWIAQSRRRVWILLMGWDLHTGAVLGRPLGVDYRLVTRTLPIDVKIPKNSRRVPLVPRSDDDPPTPLTRAIWAFAIAKPLREILDLEKEGCEPKDFSKVQKIHQEITDLRAGTPPPFRLKSPDTRFDDLPQCRWLRLARPALDALLAFDLMALHRPYIWTRSDSRHEALKASLEMLEAQKQQFAHLLPSQHRTYGLFFGTFDAIVMLAAIYIVFPKEHPELLAETRQHFHWAVERFERMAERNHLARTALKLLYTLRRRFKDAVGGGCGDYCGAGAPAVSDSALAAAGLHGAAAAGGGGAGKPRRSALDMQTPSSASEHSSNNNNNNNLGSISSVSALHANGQEATPQDSTGAGSSQGLTPAPAPAAAGLGIDNHHIHAQDAANGVGDSSSSSNSNSNSALLDWQFPIDFDFSSIPPMYPMGDVAYNDLTGVMDVMDDHVAPLPPSGHGNGHGNGNGNGGVWGGPDAESSFGIPAGLHTMPPAQEDVPWQFGGGFGSDTIWSLLNQFPPYPAGNNNHRPAR
ncbi:hypothetical protein GGR56DRAFT_614237 [Xylariaceae sp. FL0804]|nr:hypothetical protein GGR56DRAFT_614237 [Xylariaceae sp. FL0804]